MKPPSWVLALALASTVHGTAAAADVGQLAARDFPNDAGGVIQVTWRSAGAETTADSVHIERAGSRGGPWESAGVSLASAESWIDGARANGVTYYYRLREAPLSSPVSAAASMQFWNRDRTNLFIFLVVFLALMLAFVRLAKQGRSLFVRRIPALEAIEEAVGRATEMGKSVLYVPGIDDANNIQTIYSMVILNGVARMVAKYDTPLVVTVARSFVVPLAQETVKAGYMDAGRPEAYRDDCVRYLSDEQFAFTAAVNGIMLRDRPATNLFLGSFFAESLVLAETGFSTGAVQIAGTANVHQLPFFVVACDYTMIGEEFFASSAYLSREPMLVGTLKGTDAMKLLLFAALILGSLFETVGVHRFASWFDVR